MRASYIFSLATLLAPILCGKPIFEICDADEIDSLTAALEDVQNSPRKLTNSPKVDAASSTTGLELVETSPMRLLTFGSKSSATYWNPFQGVPFTLFVKAGIDAAPQE
jgi:hypothetical protein